MPRLRRSPGFTLIELMAAAAIGLLILVAAMALFNSMNQMSQDNDRSLNAVSELQLGTTLMMRNVENASYHFPTARYGIVIRNNVATGATIPNGNATTPLNVVARVPPGTTPYTAADEGIPDSSDIVEVLQGTNMGDNVQVMDPGMLAGSSRTVTFSPPMPGGQVISYNAGDIGPALLFRDPTTECVGVITGGGGVTFTITMVTQDFEPDPSPPGGCPAVGFNVYRLAERTRYMVYQFQGDTSPTLAVQRTVLADAGLGYAIGSGTLAQNVDPIAEGIEDMQVAAVLANSGGMCASTGAECICGDNRDDTDSTGNTEGADCPFAQATGIPVGTRAPYLRGVNLEFTARGKKSGGGYLAGSYDRPDGGLDGYTRLQFRMAVLAPNLNPQLSGAGDAGP
jgi:prepilin-type N-terminal cleavage/methylation domain-containing protein